MSNRSVITKQWLGFDLDIIAFSSIIGRISGVKHRVSQVLTSNTLLLTTGDKQAGLSRSLAQLQSKINKHTYMIFYLIRLVLGSRKPESPLALIKSPYSGDGLALLLEDSPILTIHTIECLIKLIQ